MILALKNKINFVTHMMTTVNTMHAKCAGIPQSAPNINRLREEKEKREGGKGVSVYSILAVLKHPLKSTEVKFTKRLFIVMHVKGYSMHDNVKG